MVPYVPRPQCGPSFKAALFRKDEFQYDEVSDSYLCPAGQRLHPYSSSLLRGLKKIDYVNRLTCDAADPHRLTSHFSWSYRHPKDAKFPKQRSSYESRDSPRAW
jgi:hypothetical protein